MFGYGLEADTAISDLFFNSDHPALNAIDDDDPGDDETQKALTTDAEEFAITISLMGFNVAPSVLVRDYFRRL